MKTPGVPSVAISRILRGPKIRDSSVQIRRYYADQQRLVLNLFNQYKGRISILLYDLIHSLIKWPGHMKNVRRGHAGELSVCQSHRVNETNGGISFIDGVKSIDKYKGGDLGTGDVARSPADREGVAGDWPILVIESVSTVHLDHLREDMPWWFKASNHAVKIVLLAKVNYKRRALIIKHWEEEDEDIARDATQCRPVNRNTICIRPATCSSRQLWTLGGVMSTTRFEIEGAPLVFKFKKLFDHDPTSNQDEDVEIPLERFTPIMVRLFQHLIPRPEEDDDDL